MNRRERRLIARRARIHFERLSDLLMNFYAFLESTPQPSNEEVRERFQKDEKAWRVYCSSHQLTEEASDMFTKEVSQSWEKRYKKKSPN